MSSLCHAYFSMPLTLVTCLLKVPILIQDGATSVCTVLVTIPRILIAGLVETSTNLASVKPASSNESAPSAYKINCSTRSSLSPALENVRDSIARLSKLVSHPERLSARQLRAPSRPSHFNRTCLTVLMQFLKAHATSATPLQYALAGFQQAIQPGFHFRV